MPNYENLQKFDNPVIKMNREEVSSIPAILVYKFLSFVIIYESITSCHLFHPSEVGHK